MKHGKKYLASAQLIEPGKLYDAEEAVAVVVKTAAAKFDEDFRKDYKVAIYGDVACTELVYSVEVVKGEKLFTTTTCPPRFIFTGLTPKTDYYIHIYNLTDTKQTLVPLKVTTASAEYTGKRFNYTTPGDVVLFENFDALIYGGDISTCAAGVSRDDRAALQSYSGADMSNYP